MKMTLIPQMAVKNCHPKGMQSATDTDYARIATEVATAMAKEKVDDIPVNGIRQMALNITMYFEDVIAGAGIWHGFTSKVKEMYGRQLPFYDIDEENYFDDEPNIEDVKFIVWYTMLEVHHGKIGNPENPILERLAIAAYNVLEQHYETVPVNESLKDYFQNPQFIDDFYKQRDALKWLYFSCYLTYIPRAIDFIYDRARQMAEAVHCPMDAAFYQVECLLAYTGKIGPLRLKPQEWMAAILRANGNDEAAQKVENQRQMDYRMYKIESTDDDRSMTFRDITGETFTVTADELNHPQNECYQRKGIVASFVEYDGAWHLNGGSSFGDDLKMFDEMAVDYEGHKNLQKAYDDMIKESKDTRLFYFADAAELKAFLLKHLPADENVEKNFQLPADQEHIVLYVPEKSTEDLQIFPDGALCVKDERNPYYNEKWSRNQALNFVLSISPEVQSCLISQHFLPDATINSSKGLERGNEIVQQNFDFLVRAVSSRL